MNNRTITLFNLKFFAGTTAEFLEILKERLQQGAPALPTLIFTPNPEQIVLAHRNPEFLFSLQQATLCIPDGVGLLWAAQIFHFANGRQPLFSERISGSDVVMTLLKHIKNQKMLLIGGRSYDADQLHVFGQHIVRIEGYRDAVHPTAQEEEKIAATIKKIEPEIIFVAFGAPKQEHFIVDHQPLFINHHVKIVMAVGGSFDFLTEKVKRAPRWVQKSGGEWLYRLIQEPWRWRRQLRLIQFMWLVFAHVASELLRFFFTEIHAQ